MNFSGVRLGTPIIVKSGSREFIGEKNHDGRLVFGGAWRTSNQKRAEAFSRLFTVIH